MIRISHVIVAALAIMANLPAAVAGEPRYGQWCSSRIGGGGYVQNVVPCPGNPNRYYAYVDVGGVYRSDDGGEHWVMLHGTLPPRRGNTCIRGLLVDPRDDSKLIVATGVEWDHTDGIYVSDDSGKSWRAVTKDLFFDGNGSGRTMGAVLARNPHNPDLVLAGSLGTGVWRSTDGGAHWRSAGLEGIETTDIKFDSGGTRVWLCSRSVKGKAGASAGLYGSSDGGANWSLLSAECPSELVQDPREPQRLYGLFGNSAVKMSPDGGQNWHLFVDGLDYDPARAGAMSTFGYRALAAGPDFVLVGASNGTVYRLDIGETRWRKVQREEIDPGRIARGREMWGWAMCSLIVDPRDSSHWFQTDYFGLSETRDAGKHWRINVAGIECTVIHAVVQDPTDSRVVHLGMADNAYFRSDDGGEAFKQHSLPDHAITCKDIALCEKAPRRLYAIGPRKWDQHIAQVYISDDRGDTWSRSPMTGLPDLKHDMCTSISVDPRDPNTLYLAVSGGVGSGRGGPYKSTDGGKSWTWVGDGLPQGSAFFWYMPWGQGRELAAGGDGTLVAISRLGESRGVYVLPAGSGTWVRSATFAGEPASVVADVLAPGRYFVGVRGEGVYRSSDSGKVWQKVFDKAATHVMVDRAVRDRVAASTADGVILSLNGGQTWQVLDRSLPDRVLANMPAFAGDRLVVGSDGSGAFWIDLPKTDLARACSFLAAWPG